MKKIAIKVLVVIVFLAFGTTIIWYINFPLYEKAAEDRIAKYMDAQKIDKNIKYTKESMKDYKLGRWEIIYKFNNEPNLLYRYSYDRKQDRVLLSVYETPYMFGGRSIDKGMNYPSLEEDWSAFDSKGNLILSSIK